MATSSRVPTCLALVLVALAGCGGGPRTSPVKGKVVFDRGDINRLSGSVLICQQQEAPHLQAFADIQDDGSFKLQTRSKGIILSGAPEGTYRAWLNLPTENGSVEKQLAEAGIDFAFLEGTTSSLTFAVPAQEDVILTVTPGQPGAARPAAQPWFQPKCGDPEEPESPL